jgi:hypothetical protein
MIPALGLTFLLVGCEDVKSVDWWQAHADDATKKVAECNKSGSDSENCKNAKEGLFRFKQLKAVNSKPIDYKDAFKDILGKDGS